MALPTQRLGHVPFCCSLDKEFQDANLWASCPAVLTKTPNQVKLVVPKASAMAHTLQSTVWAGEVEPLGWGCAGVIDVEVIADCVSSSGQSLTTKQNSKRSHHRTGMMSQALGSLLQPLPTAHKPCKLFHQTRGDRGFLLWGEKGIV